MSRGTLLHRMGSRKTVPRRMFRMVPFGLGHIFFSLNSTRTHAQLGVDTVWGRGGGHRMGTGRGLLLPVRAEFSESHEHPQGTGMHNNQAKG